MTALTGLYPPGQGAVKELSEWSFRYFTAELSVRACLRIERFTNDTSTTNYDGQPRQNVYEPYVVIALRVISLPKCIETTLEQIPKCIENTVEQILKRIEYSLARFFAWRCSLRARLFVG